MFSVIIAIILFGAIVLIHELGHFVSARLCKVKINEFSIGMGPKIFSRCGKDGIFYSLRALPIGGYVSMAGEDEESSDSDAFCNKTKLQRFSILAAGATMNILLGFLLLLISTSGSEMYSNKIESFRIYDKNQNIVSEYQGLLPGDEILYVGSSKINISYDFRFAAMRQGAHPCDITVLRDGKRVVIEGFSFPTITDSGNIFGNPYFFMPERIEKTPFAVIRESFYQTGSTIKTVVLSLYDIITGRYGAEAVSGPVGVVSEISSATKSGVLPLLQLAAMITINVGVFNLLPFPALDGGRIVFLGIEAITRKKINQKVEGYINFAGLMILFGLMIAITFKDFAKLFS